MRSQCFDASHTTGILTRPGDIRREAQPVHLNESPFESVLFLESLNRARSARVLHSPELAKGIEASGDKPKPASIYANMNYLNTIFHGSLFQKDTSGGQSRPTSDEIQRLAYQFYEQRGKRPGNELEDWLAAEQQLCLHYWGNGNACGTRRQKNS